MENIKVQNCTQCGGPVKLDKNKCEYCNSEFLVLSLTSLDKFDKTGINKYISQYKELLKKSPDDGELHCAMGICYLDLYMYDLACKYFSKAIEYIPDYPDVYYYFALSLLKGKKPGILTLSEIKKVEEYLNTAIQLEDKAKYYYLLVLIKYEFYVKNGLKVNPPNVEELINRINKVEKNDLDKAEIEKMLKRVPVDASVLRKLNL